MTFSYKSLFVDEPTVDDIPEVIPDYERYVGNEYSYDDDYDIYRDDDRYDDYEYSNESYDVY